jgi:isopenicillin N synthase-like dioxygenase
MGCGAHTDYGLFTILQQDHIGGLQVRNRAGRWIDARPLRGSFVINVGDMLSRWTCGEYASTVHRVVSSRGRGGHRYSVPFFFNPDHDAVVGPLMGGAGRRPVGGGGEESADGDDAGGGGRTALEILADRYNGTFKKSQSKS